MMKKLLIAIPLVFIFYLFFAHTSYAQSCVCNVNNTGATYVQTQCETGYIARCTGDPYHGTLGCTCDQEVTGVNCTSEGGVPVAGKPCCNGLKSFNYGGGVTCVSETLNPYKNCVTTGALSEGQSCCAGSTLNQDGTSCILYNYQQKADEYLCGNGKTGIQTAIGCIPVLGSTNEFLSAILKWAVGIGGGIAFILMLWAGFMIMTSSGNPERLKAGQELLTSAIAGLILLIFSIFILKFIGVDILGLCKFGFGTCT